MKRTMSLVATALIVISLTACTTSPNTTGKYNTNNTNTNIVRINNRTAVYRDGVYTGRSTSLMGTETAKVYIKGGKITNIVFGPIPAAQLKPSAPTAIKKVTPGTTTGRTATSISGVVTPGTSVQRNIPGNTGNLYGTTPNQVLGTVPGTISGTVPGPTVGTIPSTIPRTAVNKPEGTIVNQPSGTAQAAMSTTQIVGLRRAVANAIIKNQAYNVNVKSANSTIVNTLQNAVKNALDQARK